MSLSGFHEGRLPVPTGTGASGGPEWRTETLVLASGREVRNARWSGARRRWDIVTPPLSPAEVQGLQDFFDARRGRLFGFRFHDAASYSTAQAGHPVSMLDQSVGIGDGILQTFQLTLTLGDISKRVLKPVAASVLIGLDGNAQLLGWSVDETTGVLSFETPPPAGQVITAGFEYDWPVRFDTDYLDITFAEYGAARIIRIPLIELLGGEGE